MKLADGHDDFQTVLRALNEAGLVDVIIGDDQEVRFALSSAISEARPDAIAVLLAGIEAVADPRHSA